MNNSTVATYLKFKAKFRGALLGFASAFLASFFPIVGIRRGWDATVAAPVEMIFLSCFLLTVTVSGSAISSRWHSAHIGHKLDRWDRLALFRTVFGAFLFFMLFFAVNVLCQRLNIGIIHSSAHKMELLRYGGLALGLVALSLQFALITTAPIRTEPESGRTEPRSFLNLRHPCFFATLLMLIGMPAIFATWFPWLAMPGIFVTMKWIISRLDDQTNNQSSEATFEYLPRWKIIPYIY